MRTFFLVVVICAAGTPVAAAPNDQAAAHYKQGKTYLDAKQYDLAIKEFEAAYAIDKLSSHLFNIADAYDSKHDYDKAIEYYQKYLDVEPKSARAADVRSRISVATQARADAKRKADEDAARVAAENNRVAAVVHIKQAAAYEQAGAWDKAGDEHRLAFNVDGDPAHLIAAAEAFHKHGDLEKTRDAYAAYLERVPLGDTSDAVRAKLADTTREIEKAEIARKQEKVEHPIKAPDPRVALLAGNAQAAVARGDCPVARKLGDQVRREDSAYYDSVVAPTLATCAEAIPVPPRRIGGGAELRLIALNAGNITENGQVTSKGTLGQFPPSPNTVGLGGFVDLALLPRLRIRPGLRAYAGTTKFDIMGCPAATACATQLKVAHGGPTVSIEAAVIHRATWDLHLIAGGAVLIPLGTGRVTLQNGSTEMDGPDVKLAAQLAFEFGLGIRYGRLFANLAGGANTPGISKDLDVSSGGGLTFSVGGTSLR